MKHREQPLLVLHRKQSSLALLPTLRSLDSPLRQTTHCLLAAPVSPPSRVLQTPLRTSTQSLRDPSSPFLLRLVLRLPITDTMVLDLIDLLMFRVMSLLT